LLLFAIAKTNHGPRAKTSAKAVANLKKAGAARKCRIIAIFKCTYIDFLAVKKRKKRNVELLVMLNQNKREIRRRSEEQE
jgi:hypothetical protein